MAIKYHPDRLNPFRAGRCLSTLGTGKDNEIRASQSLSFRAMSFDLNIGFAGKNQDGSQSLSIRAISFDKNLNSLSSRLASLNPFRSGRCLSTAVCWRQESCGLSDPLPNFFRRLRSWLLI